MVSFEWGMGKEVGLENENPGLAATRLLSLASVSAGLAQLWAVASWAS